MIFKICILVAIVALCSCGIGDLLSEGILGRLAEDLLATSVSAVGFLPKAISNQLGFFDLPVLVTEKNILDYGPDINLGCSGNEDCHLQINGLIEKNGYTMENYTVETEDGYLLHLFRIKGEGKPVFLMHQLLGASDDFVLTGPENGLAYLLAADGYDVWLGNARGTKHSRRHKRLHPRGSGFWDFSWHEIGYYDLPAMIDTALDVTGQPNLVYIGHSQGATAFYVMASQRPDYQSKVSSMVGLAPVAFLSYGKSPILKIFAPMGPLLNAMLKLFGLHEFLPAQNIVIKTLMRVMCGVGRAANMLCSNVIMLFAGFSFDELDRDSLPMIYSHTPSGAASKQFVHYAQVSASGEFKKFDRGARANSAAYGSQKPPQYDLSLIETPCLHFYSNGDWLAHPKDVATLESKLPNVVDSILLEHRFNHVDFVWSKNFRTVIYERLSESLAQGTI